MKMFIRIVGLILLMSTTVPLPAQTNMYPSHPARQTTEPAMLGPPPKPGWALAVNLGQEEVLQFVWIGPLNIWVGRFEVTNGQYNRFDAGHESKSYYGHQLNAPNQPVVWVSWEDANNYCNWLTRTFSRQIPSGYSFRLPTESEWEIFASCNGRYRFPWGNNWPPPAAFNYRGEEGIGFLYSLFQHEPYIDNHNDRFIVTCPVRQSGANAWDIYGLGGNAWEWCQDWYDDKQITRSLRGASWNNYEPDIITIYNRSDAYPVRSNPMIGFRVVLAPIG